MQESIGLLVARLIFGLYIIGHGGQKLFGWFGGHGLLATSSYFEQLGYRPGRAFATAASVAEIAGGVLLALGFLGPIGPALIISVMIVAIGSVHWRHGLFTSKNGIELPLLFAAAAFAVALTGPGLISLDAQTGLGDIWTVDLTWVVVGLGIVGGLVNLAIRRPVGTLVPGGSVAR